MGATLAIFSVFGVVVVTVVVPRRIRWRMVALASPLAAALTSRIVGVAELRHSDTATV
ncbi:hypothetical protein D3C72_2283570 [compost metagenome]